MRSLCRHPSRFLVSRKEPLAIIRCQEKKPVSTQTSSEVVHLFNSMTYGPAPEDNANVDAWLDSHNRRFGMFINNQWVVSASSAGSEGGEVGEDSPSAPATASSINPANGEFLAETVQATVEDMDAAVAAAKAAFPSWSATSGHERARYLYSIARHLQKHHRLMACLESVDNGKTIRETRDADVPLAVRHFYSHAGWAQLMDTEMSGYQPLGVIGQVIPWNFPLLMLAWKVAPAIAMGNTLVIKPAPSTRLSAWLFADILVEAGLPKGVVNIVTGDNDVAAHLVEHPDVDKVAFTGSTGVGRKILADAAMSNKLHRVTLELGGKSPLIVLKDADIDAAVAGAHVGLFLNQGQCCCAGSRIFVEDEVYDEFVAKSVEEAKKRTVGPGYAEGSMQGPQVSQEQFDSVMSYIESGKRDGASLLAGGNRVGSQGYFIEPTVFADVQDHHTIAKEEIFGPVMSILKFSGNDDLIARANDTEYGLAAAVYSKDFPRARGLAQKLRAGTVWINCYDTFDAALPFGGFKASGIGRELGESGLMAYLEQKTMVVAM